ncbi:MAG: hypothetical protein ACREU4_13115 [Burkholderiales bacterium]
MGEGDPLALDPGLGELGGDALLERLLALYAKKYPREIASWRDKMRDGYESGDRLLLRYTPL